MLSIVWTLSAEVSDVGGGTPGQLDAVKAKGEGASQSLCWSEPAGWEQASWSDVGPE